MKNALTTNSNESAQDKCDYTPGSYPVRRNTVRADALAALLMYQFLTGLESVFSRSTTRLSPVICDAIEKLYGWPVLREDRVVDTEDGRVASIVAYYLHPETIRQALEVGAQEFIDSVIAARAGRRREANKIKIAKAQKKAARDRLRKQDPQQGNLWGDAL
ncbi:MAG: hypothetical protein K2X64_07765 [Rhodocyclaceae bacterium]|nr:hypothetical protein [Rhodocyclaceae bacterium]